MQTNSRAVRHAEQRYQIHIQRNLTLNFLAQLAHGMLGQTGFRLVMAPTFIPAYIMMLSGGSQFMVGLALSLQALGMMLTPLIGANFIEHRTRVLLGGILAATLGYQSVFLVSITFLLIGGTVVRFYVPEPRNVTSRSDPGSQLHDSHKKLEVSDRSK